MHVVLNNKSPDLHKETILDPTWPSWQYAMKTAIRSPETLINMLSLPKHFIDNAFFSSTSFRLFVPHSFIARMEVGNINDPLLRQVLPVVDETRLVKGFVQDPLEEKQANPLPGLLHKYKNRVLVFPSTQCAIHCRYCFRRHFSYEDHKMNKEKWHRILCYLKEHTEIDEVIYSGGDPLVLNDQRLSWLTKKIEKISHIKRLRIHSRIPIVIPERINDELLAWLTDTRLKTIMVVHCNHANEMAASVAHAMQQLRKANVTLLNQSVLLRGVNDSVTALSQLSETLLNCGVLPYYIHLLDRVEGTAHFEVPEHEARVLLGALSQSTSGYLVPRLAREMPGMASKLILAPLWQHT